MYESPRLKDVVSSNTSLREESPSVIKSFTHWQSQRYSDLYYKRLLALILFSLAFAFVEATVVSYLKIILGTGNNFLLGNYQILLNLRLIAFIKPVEPLFSQPLINQTEVIREFATILMLLSVAYLSGQSFKQKLAAFLISFALWDLF